MAARTSPSTLRQAPKPAAATLNKHQQKTQAMKLRLLKAARRIFTRDGFEAARIDDIAAAAGHTRGAFYAHFKTKEDLFLALIEQETAAHMDDIRAKMHACTTEQEQVDMLRKYYSARLADRAFSILLIEFKLYALRHPRLRAHLADAHRQIRDVLKLGVEGLLPAQFQVRSESRELKRVALESLLTGLILENTYDPKRISERQVESVLGQMFDMVQDLSAS
ncbi:MAG: TetR/AcrR family transcriptional regulator [Acidobacteriaceae bacterium]|nr:TetR/AcrR family transcriptional regulator [Acidobacteriaceae bacterium]